MEEIVWMVGVASDGEHCERQAGSQGEVRNFKKTAKKKLQATAAVDHLQASSDTI